MLLISFNTVLKVRSQKNVCESIFPFLAVMMSVHTKHIASLGFLEECLSKTL